MPHRNQNIVLNYVDNIKGGQVRLLKLSGSTDEVRGSGLANEVAYWADPDHITGSAGLKFVSGSQTLYSDNGYLIFSSSQSKVAVSGTLFVTENIGIGIDSPTGDLEIRGGTAGAPIAIFSRSIGGSGKVSINASANDPKLLFENNAGAGGGDQWAAGVDNTNSDFIIASGTAFGAGNDFLRIDNQGNVGIGVSPNVSLDISGAFSVRGILSSSSPTRAPTDEGRIYFDKSFNKFRASESDVGYKNLLNFPHGASVTLTTATTFISSRHNPFTQGTSTNENGIPRGIEFDASSGRFTVSESGYYKIDVPLILEISTTQGVIIDIDRNGTTIYTYTPTVHSSVDPVERTAATMAYLDAGDYVEVFVDGQAASVQTDIGSTFNIHMVAPADSSHVSVTLTTPDGGPFSGTLFDVWQSDNYPSFASGTDFAHNADPKDIVYTPADGRFTFDRSGLYKISMNAYLSSSTTLTVDFDILKNGASVFSAPAPFVHSALDPLERSFTILQDINSGDFIEVTADASADGVSMRSGSTFSAHRLDIERHFPSSFISVSTLSNSNGTTVLWDVFDSGNYASFVEGTDWQHNIRSDKITYNPALGDFTVNEDGVYLIEINLVLGIAGGSPEIVELYVRKNSVNIWNATTAVHSVADPVERTITIIEALNSGDAIDVLLDSVVNNVQANAGTSIHIHRIY